MSDTTNEPRDPEDEARWAFLSFRTIGPARDPYLRRLTLVQTPWFSVKLHRIYRPDWQRDLHDHPWWFLSLLLWGWYEEDVPAYERCARWRRGRCVPPSGRDYARTKEGSEEATKEVSCGCSWPNDRTYVQRRWWSLKRATGRHAISWLSRPCVWTLVITGPRVRTWGFWVDGGTRFVPWDVYLREYRDA